MRCTVLENQDFVLEFVLEHLVYEPWLLRQWLLNSVMYVAESLAGREWVMVKVQDEEPRAAQAATPNRRSSHGHGPTKVPPAGTSNVATPHFHYHYTYPPTSGPNPSPATFHFGPGFEPQTSPQQHVVYFHVNPGVTVSFQMGDNVQVIKGKLTIYIVR